MRAAPVEAGLPAHVVSGSGVQLRVESLFEPEPNTIRAAQASQDTGRLSSLVAGGRFGRLETPVVRVAA